MIKIFILLSAITVFSACADNKLKSKSGNELIEQSAPTSGEMTSDDKLMKEWLLGKEWKADSFAAPIGRLKIFSPDSCDFIMGKCPWGFKNGRFTFGRNVLADWPFVKVNDTTFTLYVEPTQKTYTYSFVRKL